MCLAAIDVPGAVRGSDHIGWVGPHVILRISMARSKARDEFSAAIIRRVERRAGHKCSNPGCLAPTSGPQLDPDKAVNVGVAGHITGASPGGPRYDAQLTTDLRCSISNAIWLCQTCGKLIDDDILRHPPTVLREWKREGEKDAERRVGKTQAKRSPASTAEHLLKRDLKTRDELQKVLIAPWDQIQQRHKKEGRERPFHKFLYSKILICQLGVDKYQETPADRISSSFTLELFDFYHNGIEFIMGIESGAIENRDSNAWNLHWATIPYGAKISDDFRRINIWHLGLIPFRNIRHCDPQGDEYSYHPHLYCDFNIDGMPYERFEHAVVAKDGEFYDWPLKAQLRLPREAVILQDA